jgi:hypothetical protein
MVWADRTLQPGTVVAGYRIESVIGRGATGVVYRAVQERLGRTVALKVLSPALLEEEGYEARFLRESQLAASLDHPNVLQVYDAGDADGVPYIAMRHVGGGDLRALLRREGTLSPERTAGIVSQVAGALDAAHEAGLIHRDVKPANVMVGDGDRVYLGDFGVAKPSGQTEITRTGAFLGTVDYCPPEQINGEALDRRADVYALGCLTFHCLTGQPPFPRETEVAVIMAHLSEPVPAVTTLRPDLPSSLDGVIATATAKNREVRYATAGALAAALERAVDQPDAGGETAPIWDADEPTAAATEPLPEPATAIAERRQVGPPAPPPRDTVRLPGGGRRRRVWLIAGAAAGLLALAGAGAAVLTLGGDDGGKAADTAPPPPPPPPPPSPFPGDAAATIRPLVPLQAAVNRRLDALRPGDPVGPLQTAAEALDRAVLDAQGRAGALAPATSGERRVAALLNGALQRHADYVAAVEVLPGLRRLTRADAARVVDRAGRVDAAYLRLSGASAGMPEMPATRGSALGLVALVPAAPAEPAARSIALAPLLVDPLPDDPPGEGRCFGPYRPGATLTLGGVARSDGFVSCGDYGFDRGDPTRATGEYRFAATALPPGYELTRFTATVGVDEDSAGDQAGSTVTWTLYYGGDEICSRSTVWSGGTTPPIRVECDLPAGRPADTGAIVIAQEASVASGTQFWAGVQDPTVTAVRS